MEHKLKSLENKIQFCVVLSMFLPVLLEALFDISKSGEGSGVIMKYGIIVFFLILNYLLFEWRKERLTLRQLDYINWVFVSMTLCFAVVILFFALLANDNLKSLTLVSYLSFPAALTGIMYLPLVSIGVILFTFFKEVQNSFVEFNWNFCWRFVPSFFKYF